MMSTRGFVAFLFHCLFLALWHGSLPWLSFYTLIATDFPTSHCVNCS